MKTINEWGEYQTFWEDKANRVLLGKTVTEVRYLSKAEMAESFSDWYSVPIAIFFDDGTWIVPQSDGEGNNGGALCCSSRETPTIPAF